MLSIVQTLLLVAHLHSYDGFYVRSTLRAKSMKSPITFLFRLVVSTQDTKWECTIRNGSVPLACLKAVRCTQEPSVIPSTFRSRVKIFSSFRFDLNRKKEVCDNVGFHSPTRRDHNQEMRFVRWPETYQDKSGARICRFWPLLVRKSNPT